MRTRLLVAALALCAACSPRGQAAADAGSPLAVDSTASQADSLPTMLDSQSKDQLDTDAGDSQLVDGFALDSEHDTGLGDSALMDGALVDGVLIDDTVMDDSTDADGSTDTLDQDAGVDSGDVDGGADVVDIAYPQATYNSAPAVKVHPWPPPCPDPKFIGPLKNEPNCWELPEHWCKSAGAPAFANSVTPACSADGTQCCAFFNSGCLPCGWVDCFGHCGFGDPTFPDLPSCPPQCKNQPSPWKGKDAKLWYSPACQLLAKVLGPPDAGGGKVDSCAICGTDVYCKWKKP